MAEKMSRKTACPAMEVTATIRHKRLPQTDKQQLTATAGWHDSVWAE